MISGVITRLTSEKYYGGWAFNNVKFSAKYIFNPYHGCSMVVQQALCNDKKIFSFIFDFPNVLFSTFLIHQEAQNILPQDLSGRDGVRIVLC